MRCSAGFLARLLGLAILMTAVGVNAAHARPVRCVLTGSIPYTGKCDFTHAGASFSLSPIGRASFPDGVNPVSVAIVAPGVAEVHGLTREGINSRWGEAHRSKRDPACWEGSDFRICAY